PLPEFLPDAVAPAFAAGRGPWVCAPTGDGRLANSDRNNFAPRGGIAWDMFGNGKTVLRFGIGWYYDQQPINHFSQLLFNRPTGKGSNPNALQGAVAFDTTGFCPAARSCAVGNSILNPSVQAATTLNGVDPNSLYGVSAHPFAVYARDLAHSNTPYTRQMSASVQQALGNHLALEVAYIGTSGKQLPVVFNSNYQEEMQIFENNTLLFQANQRAGNFTFVPVYTMTNQAESSYHSLMARVRAADWHGLRLHAAYSLSNSEDNASTGFFPTLPDTLNAFGVGYQRGLSSNAAILCLIGTVPGACTNNPLVFPSLDFSSAAVTTTGAGRILTSRYQIPQDPFN
ncbi:MAG: hypothetical protein L0099_17330, partial [Acidobacteria bacterium]|nr:hypothetical protein [Acidobacteriota bacterium]